MSSPFVHDRRARNIVIYIIFKLHYAAQTGTAALTAAQALGYAHPEAGTAMGV